jgi:hypothetical protein
VCGASLDSLVHAREPLCNNGPDACWSVSRSVNIPDGNHASFLRLLVQLLESSDLSAAAVAGSAANTAPDLGPFRGYVREYVLCGGRLALRST